MEYNVSDLKYYKERCNAIAKGNDRYLNTCRYYIYEDEVKLSEKEKIDFIDNNYLLRGNKGGATYMLNLMDKYNAEKDSLKKDSWGYVKTNSLKAWLKRNDPWGIVDDHITIMGTILLVVMNIRTLVLKPLDLFGVQVNLHHTMTKMVVS